MHSYRSHEGSGEARFIPISTVTIPTRKIAGSGLKWPAVLHNLKRGSQIASDARSDGAMVSEPIGV